MVKRFFRVGILVWSLVLGSGMVSGQVGGKYTYSFLSLPNSARVAALGGKMVSVPDHDLNITFHNPAILAPENDNQMIMNYADYFSDIRFGYFSYAKDLGKIGTFAGGIQFINYGQFIAADEAGVITGSFKASEYAINLIYARPLPWDSAFTVGVNLKPVFSSFERYSSFGFAMDIGINYIHPEGLFSAGLVFKNAGFQLNSYDSGKSEPLPFEIQAGLTKKLRHAPFRLHLVVQHLETYKLSSDGNQQESEQAQVFAADDRVQTGFQKFGDNLMRHFILGVEFVPAHAFSLRVGYNYQRRKDLQIPTRISTVGFSWGFGIQLKTFELSFGRATYHLAGASNQFALLVNLNEIYRKVLK